jgi:hypothetical protein
MLRTHLTDALAGAFSGSDRIHASQWGGAETARADVDGRWELGAGLLVQRWRDTRAADTFELVNVFMEDPATGETLLYAFDSAGFPPDPPARGGWDGDTLTLVRRTERGQARWAFTPTTGGFAWRKEFRVCDDDPWSPVVDGALTRAGHLAEVSGTRQTGCGADA